MLPCFYFSLALLSPSCPSQNRPPSCFSRTLHPQWHDAEALTYPVLILPCPFPLSILSMSLPFIRPSGALPGPSRPSLKALHSLNPTAPPRELSPPFKPTHHHSPDITCPFSPLFFSQAQNASLPEALIPLLKSYPLRSSSQTTEPTWPGIANFLRVRVGNPI